MLDIIRNLVSSIFGKILLAIMVLSFALWGVGDILSSGNSQLAAKVGNEKISLDEFYIKFQQTVRDYNQNTNSNLSLKEAYELKLHNLLLQDLIYSRMVNDYAKKRGIYLNEESLKSVISNLDEFKDSNEIFSNIKYKNFILNNFQSEEAFLSEIENSIFQGIIFESFNADNYINDAIINKLYDYEGEKRTISYFLLNKNEVKIDTNNNLINDYYLDNKSNYLIPEKTIIDFIEVNINDFKRKENINTVEAQDYYNNNIDQYTEEESRNIQFIRFSNESEAYDFYDAVVDKNINDFNEYIKINDFKLSNIDKFTGGTFSKNISEFIFKLDVNTLSEPISYDDLGFYLFKVNEVNDEKVINFETVKNEILEYLALEAAYQEFDDAINILDELLINDYTFDEIVENSVNIKVSENVDFEQFVLKLGEENSFLDENTPVGFISEIIIKENIAYIYTVKEKQKSYVPDLEKIREKVIIDYVAEQKDKNLDKLSDDILNSIKIQKEDSFSEYVLNNDYNLLKLEKINRTNSDFQNETVFNAFNNKLNQPFKILTSDGGIGIGVVTEIIMPRNQISDDFYNSVKININNNFNSSLVDIMASEIIQNSSYEIYDQNIDKLFM
ncbi:MAG: peptidylprolyl isomerase [Candidatus Pelagibacterales bacterium]|nr:MAG: peptidylprolyl isomerase [Pelagibacterales bacterium]